MLRHKKWNKIANDIKLVFYSSTNTTFLHITTVVCKSICCVLDWLSPCLYILNTTEMQYLKILDASQPYIHQFQKLKRKWYNCNTSTYFNQKCLRNSVMCKNKCCISDRLYPFLHNMNMTEMPHLKNLRSFFLSAVYHTQPTLSIVLRHR